MENQKSPSPGTQVRILIVDDHPNTAVTLARAMTQLGPDIEVISADSGERALQLVQNRAVDLLITDMVMPGINGLELIEKLQSHPGGRPSYNVLITAFDVPGLKESARRLKVNEIIIKPVRPERICQLVAKAIEGLGHTPPVQALETKPQLKILVADDLPDNVALLTRYLQNEGYACLTAADGVQTLASIRAELPDLVLLDVNMPVKDGFQALQEIRADPAIGHIPVIILTAARLDPADMQSALNMGADDYVTKPFDRRELLARIRTRLRVKEAEDLIRRRNKELNLLPEIGREMSARLDVNELVDVILRRTVETLGALLGHITLLTAHGTQHKTYHFSTPTSLEEEFQPDYTKKVLAQVKETRQGFIIDDARTNPGWQLAEGDPTRSVVIVPMFGRHNLLGLLILAHEQVGYFNVEHKLLLQAIASQAAIALENAQLHANTARSQQSAASVLQGRLHAAMILDQGGRLAWLSPTQGKLFANPSVKLGEELKPGGGYDPLIQLLEQARASGEAAAGEIPWPDGRMFTALLAPMEESGTLVLLQKAAQPKEALRVQHDQAAAVKKAPKKAVSIHI